MITVRFSTGVAVQYNDGNFVQRYTGYSDISTADPAKGGKWIAQVTNDAIIEVTRPCRVYNPIGESGELLDAMVDALDRRRGQLDVYKLAALKKRLTKFDALRKTWKP